MKINGSSSATIICITVIPTNRRPGAGAYGVRQHTKTEGAPKEEAAEG